MTRDAPTIDERHRETRKYEYPNPKSEARNAKYETNSKFECSNDQKQCTALPFGTFEFQSFDIVSDFDIRISDLFMALDVDISTLDFHCGSARNERRGHAQLEPGVRHLSHSMGGGVRQS
ncbi:MAG: hypothetical protein A2Z25_07440 [Planctomycetes bacterium RBG_16_55_9]|nr:MAG: hypothetical protein A2Z25_07440 [Planctomycetes bacterium RBG_16_55_9]